jgi:glutathione S-transferase
MADHPGVALIQLLGRTSSINVRKVLWLAAELGLPLAQVPWATPERPTRTPEFLALNPNAQVPVLIEGEGDGAFVLWESNTICRYLAGREGRDDLLPQAPRERARVEQWMDWQATDLNSAWRYAFLALVRQSPAHQDGAAVAASVAAWNRHMAILDGQLQQTGAFVAGPHFTLADIVIGVAVHRWRRTPIERPALAAVDAYVGRLATQRGYAVGCPADEA